MTETAIAVWADRHIPPALVQQQCQALARLQRDPDSHPDVFTMAAYLAAAAPGPDIAISTDSVRRAPAELITTMLTLANITEGRASFHVGGGEVRQTGPFGHPTNQGMSRMEDLFRIFRLVLEHTAAYADGLAVTCPPAWPNAERFAAEREKLLARVEQLGRDPDQFRFAIWFPVLLADDEDDLLAAISNPLLKWLSALFGRIDNTL